MIVDCLLMVFTWDTLCLASSLRTSDFGNGSVLGCEKAMPTAEMAAPKFRQTKPIRKWKAGL